MIPIKELWKSFDLKDWQSSLDFYWTLVQPKNLELEHSLDKLTLDKIRNLNAESWYAFLKDEYFRWKYTAPNRYASTTKILDRFVADGNLTQLDNIREQLLDLKIDEIYNSLEVARRVPGLGTAGASGLLSLMYPHHFGTVDQFVVKALTLVEGLTEAGLIAKMKPESLTTNDGVTLINIFRRKALENNKIFQTDFWTPRVIDKVLWTYGR